MLPKDYVPVKPFPDFKWKWASFQCTEGINDPVILLGILFRMHKLEGRGLSYSSDEFAKELIELAEDTNDSITDVDLANRVGDRNIMRNSQQYWKAVGLIPDNNVRGRIALTEFGRRVATREISQTEFSALTVQTLKLPNPHIQKRSECLLWESHSVIIYPLRIILSVILELKKRGQGYLTPNELRRIIVPLSGCHAQIEDYVNFVLWYRDGEISIANWPDCCTRDNDHRIVREFLLFLSNYGYLVKHDGTTNETEQYHLNDLIEAEISDILSTPITDASLQRILEQTQTSKIASEVERKRVQSYRTSRPNQAAFRKEVLRACQRCVITNVIMPEILEAAHIKPVKYNGEDTVANGFAMRTDIHTLFDAGHLRISVDGSIELSHRARMDYGATIPPRIVIPDFINRDFLRWRWDNYNGM